MGTQNTNESFNSLIWDRAPKTMFLNRQSIITATSLAILDFNCGLFGLKFISNHLGLVWTDRLKCFCESKTVEKLKKANVKANHITLFACFGLLESFLTNRKHGLITRTDFLTVKKFVAWPANPTRMDSIQRT